MCLATSAGAWEFGRCVRLYNVHGAALFAGFVPVEGLPPQASDLHMATSEAQAQHAGPGV